MQGRGQGEGEDRALVGYEADDANLSELEGLSRKEYYIDQRNCETTSLDPVHDTFYLALLHTKGREKYQVVLSQSIRLYKQQDQEDNF